jgi:hypothetical protein
MFRVLSPRARTRSVQVQDPMRQSGISTVLRRRVVVVVPVLTVIMHFIRN